MAVCNLVHLTDSNATPISHEKVLAVKNAFVKALSSNGVDANEIARIRRDLGLASEAGMDKTLHERSLKPLTRQQVRAILDRNAVAINAHADQGLDLNKFGAKVSDLGDQIRRGENPAATDAGLELLKGLQTRRAPAGYIKYMIDAARRAPIDALSKLRRRSTPRRDQPRDPPAQRQRRLHPLWARLRRACRGRRHGHP